MIQKAIIVYIFMILTSNVLVKADLCCQEEGDLMGLNCRCRQSCAGSGCQSAGNLGINANCGSSVCCCGGNQCTKEEMPELDSCPTSSPSIDPTSNPTKDPTTNPTNDPTRDPTQDPTNDPTKDPTTDPTTDPTADPTRDPTQDPTQDPTNDPSRDPTTDPTLDPTTEPTLDPTCVLSFDEDLNFDYRGVVFQPRPSIRNCPNIVSTDEVNNELNIEIIDSECPISMINCQNITTDGAVTLKPNQTLPGSIQATPTVTSGENILVTAEFFSNTSIQTRPVFNAPSGSITIAPKFITTGSFISYQRFDAATFIKNIPFISADRYIITAPIMSVPNGNVTLAPRLRSFGPIIIWPQVIQSKNIFVESNINTPDEVIIIPRFTRTGLLINSANITAGKGVTIIPNPTLSKIFIANKVLVSTVVSDYTDFTFITNINTLKQFDNDLFRFAFGLNILNNDDIENVMVKSNYLDIKQDGSIILGIFDDENNINLELYQQDIGLILNEKEEYLLEISVCNKSISLSINNDLKFERQELEFFDQGKIGILGQESLLQLEFIQCIQQC